MKSNIFFNSVSRGTFLLSALTIIFFCLFANAGTFETISIQQNDAFRRDIMLFAEKILQSRESEEDEKNLDTKWFNGGSPSFYLIRWSTKITLYSQGKKVASGMASSSSLSKTLKKSMHSALQEADPKSLKNIYMKVTFYYPPDARQYSMISEVGKLDNHGLPNELIGNIVPVRQFDTALVKKRIHAETAYLLRMIHPEVHGFFKKYDAKNDFREKKIRTIYTASSLYTLLKVQEIMPNSAVEKQIEPIANFLLSMQNLKGENAGAFHYSYDEATGKKDLQFPEGRFVVGTSSKTIFTLLKLYQKTHDVKYLNSAKQAGDWLVTRIKANGNISPVSVHINGKLINKTRQSFLYSGQVLSALSRLYGVTHDKSYYDKATLLAQHMLNYVQNKSPFLGDDYRAPNSVSTSWVVMALIDYVKVNPSVKTNNMYKKIITRCADELVYHQIRAPWDAFNDGRLMDIITTSGNGWVNEVMTELYPVCQSNKMQNCKKYREFIINSSRWLVQNVYTSSNSYALKNPTMADGGVIRNFAEHSVRTDAVCHGLNSLVGLLAITGTDNQELLFLPEMPFDEVLGLLEMSRNAE